jgi:hypothetical protein
MKKVKTILFILMLSIANQVIAQDIPVTEKDKKENTSKSQIVKSTKNNNFLDMQANVLTGIFGENLDGKTTGKSIGFLELLEKTELPENQKLEYRNQYYLLSKELTQSDKDSLGRALEQKIIEAQNNSNN